jgi:hypothetical protein
VVGRIDLGGNPDGHGTLHGYLLRRGRFTTIDPPGSGLTSARGIDDAGRIVGFYQGGDDGGVHGFLLDGRGYRNLDVPGADVTVAMGINVTRIVGGWNASGCEDCFDRAFLLTRRGFEELAFPGALGTVAYGINASGRIVGTYVTQDGWVHGFLRDGGDDN